MRPACSALLIALCSLLLTGVAQAAEKIRVARYDTGGVAHPALPLLIAAFRDVGLEPVLVDMPLSRSLSETDRGVMVDADPGRTLEAIRKFPNVVAVPEPVEILQLAAFIRHGTAPVNGWAGLQKRHVVVFNGSVTLDRLLAEHHVNDLYRADTYAGAALMLAFHRADTAILPRAETLAVLKKYGITTIEPSGPSLAELPVYVILNKRFAAYAPKLAEAIRRARRAR